MDEVVTQAVVARAVVSAGEACLLGADEFFVRARLLPCGAKPDWLTRFAWLSVT